VGLALLLAIGRHREGNDAQKDCCIRGEGEGAVRELSHTNYYEKSPRQNDRGTVFSAGESRIRKPERRRKKKEEESGQSAEIEEIFSRTT